MVELPATAAWRHLAARVGFEVVFLRREGDGYHVEGHATAVETARRGGSGMRSPSTVGWTTRSAQITGRSVSGVHEVRLEGDGTGGWRVDGTPAPELDGCLDVDLEASAFTNAFPVRRLGLGVGDRAEAPAAYVRATDLRVERLEQTYARLEDDGERSRYDYASPAFDFRAEVVYDRFGLVLDYPGIAVRVS